MEGGGEGERAQDFVLTFSCLHSRTTQRGISLHKFLALSTDLLPAAMFSSLMNMLRVSVTINIILYDVVCFVTKII